MSALLSYKLVYNKPVVKHEKLDPKDENYRESVLRRVLSGCIFHVGDTVRIRGTPLFAEVFTIVRNHNEVNWVNNSPMFIGIVTSDGVHKMASARQLKLINRKSA